MDSTIRLKQINQSEISGFVSQITSGILSNGQISIAATGKLTGAFYPLNSNPASYTQSGDFLSHSDLDEAMVAENAYIASTYYPISNPNNYSHITGLNATIYYSGTSYLVIENGLIVGTG